MPKTKGQGLVFGILMSVTMAYGMEVYNVALKSGVLQHVGGFSDMRNTVFLGALKEAAFMWLFVFLFSNLGGIGWVPSWLTNWSAPKTARFCKYWRVLAVRYWLCALQ